MILFDAGERFRTDEGVECEVIEVVSAMQFIVRRLDTGEVTTATATRRHPPKGWEQISGKDA